MKIVVIGIGHVGLVTAATFAHYGHEVIGLDDDPAKIEILQKGGVTFFEEGLASLLKEVTGAGRLSFSDDYAQSMKDAEIAFICVGTPPRADGEANMVAVENVAWSAASNATRELVLVQKATVPVRTAERIRRLITSRRPIAFHLVSNPEFLREGTAVADSLKPDRILVGAETAEPHRIMRALYQPMIDQGAEYFATDIPTAELAKHACNSFLAMKISYANALAEICEASGADIEAIADVMGSDRRIGRDFLNPGLGYGGYCLPKDVAAFKSMAHRLGYDFALLDAIMAINQQALERVFEKVKEALWNLEGKKILLLGLSFKPGTDDVRQSPSIALAKRLMDAGALVVGNDPESNLPAQDELAGLQVSEDLYAAAEGAECIVIATDWPQFAGLDLTRLKGVMNRPLIIDARNLLDPSSVAEAGFAYIPTGRPALNL